MSQNEVKSLLIVTDAWHPQINGVVRSLERTRDALEAQGIKVHFLSPLDFWTTPMPGYREIRLSLVNPWKVRDAIDRLRPDSIHIATEGPLGMMVRHYCKRRGFAFSTSYHTQFAEYLRARLPIPLGWSYRFLNWFHSAAQYCLVPTATVAGELQGYGFTNTVLWARGVDIEAFHPSKRDEEFGDPNCPRPIFLYVGRLAVEKNISDFLDLDLPGTKLVVGDGPARSGLQRRHPQARFVGSKQGEELAKYYASADVFVFPSRTDTFGLVMLEALASGTPVAAYPVRGPLDVVGGSGVAVLDFDLKKAAMQALDVPREQCRAYATRFSWSATTADFAAHLPYIDRSGHPMAKPS